LRYINENLCTLSGVEEVANHLFISESYLFRMFKNELHQTPKKYILEKRLLMAQKKILSGEKPSDVSVECGFGDYTVFYRNYLSRFGHAPSVDTVK
jgi:AraC-like DNA-binding protein